MTEKKLIKARQACIDAMKFQALTSGGNAVVGIGLEYTEFAR